MMIAIVPAQKSTGLPNSMPALGDSGDVMCEMCSASPWIGTAKAHRRDTETPRLRGERPKYWWVSAPLCVSAPLRYEVVVLDRPAHLNERDRHAIRQHIAHV